MLERLALQLHNIVSLYELIKLKCIVTFALHLGARRKCLHIALTFYIHTIERFNVLNSSPTFQLLSEILSTFLLRDWKMGLPVAAFLWSALLVFFSCRVYCTMVCFVELFYFLIQQIVHSIQQTLKRFFKTWFSFIRGF